MLEAGFYKLQIIQSSLIHKRRNVANFILPMNNYWFRPSEIGHGHHNRNSIVKLSGMPCNTVKIVYINDHVTFRNRILLNHLNSVFVNHNKLEPTQIFFVPTFIVQYSEG